MKRVLLVLSVVGLALPAFANSITGYGSHAGGRYVSGDATMWMGKQSTGNPAWGTLDGGSALSKGGAFAFSLTRWTDSSTNIVDYTGGSLSAHRKGPALSGVHTQRLNLISGGSINGHLFTNGHGRGSESLRAPVPEPETLGLLGTGLFFIGGLVRRKMKMRELLRSSHNL